MFRVSCIQLKSNDDFLYNLKRTQILIKKAINQKADFILTPEVSSFFSLNKKKLLEKCTSMKKDQYLIGIKKLAKNYKKWILVGSLVIKKEKNKLFNRSVLINPKGAIVSYYDKIHMYDAVLSKKESYFESKTFFAGKKINYAKLPWGRLGFSICYDLRFPTLYRKLAQKGCIFLSIPAAFTETTGKKHWLTLLKARAIENFSYVFAPAQAGKHFNGRKTFGNSVIVSPEGKIIKQLKKKEGVITALINPKLPMILRKKIPSLLFD
jgi:deaminated glutathione amidase